ncbi:Bud site selection protein, Revert to axial protein 1 [Thelotrema lepadinum]|nr:Bud site selection protein, Revert to axial protein 1 [Thelotrema lepadinum]
MADDGRPELANNRHRLPTLNEVLQRRTLAPVDLFSFYIYMRDQQRSVDYLDFWLDVLQHMSLCRHYVRELRRSVLLDTPEAETKQTSKRSSMILDQFGQLDSSGPSDDEKTRDQHVSAFLRQDTSHSDSDRDNLRVKNSNHSPQSSLGSNRSGGTERPSNGNIPPSRGTGTERPPRPSFMSSHVRTTTDSNSPAHQVARADLRASAEKILYTYLLAGSEREIILPQSILNDIISSIEDDHRDDPEVFDAAKDYVFQAMERDAFPGFLRSKALGNLVPPSMFARLILGIVGIFGGLWAGFACIFLDLSRATRAFLIIPFAIGVYSLASQQYALDPLMALLGFSEYTFMNWSRVRDPYIRELLMKRGSMSMTVTVIIAAAIIILFVFVPGKRL